MQKLSRPIDLLAASDGDPLVTHLLPHVVPDGPLLSLDGAVLFAYDYWESTGVQLVGRPEPCAALLRDASADLPTRDVAVPEEAAPLLAGAFMPDDPWCFRWTDTRPPAPSLEAQWLGDDEHDDVEALLAKSFPDASSRPGNRHARRWAGIRNHAGTLIATAADCTESEVGFMASVATDVQLRRSGLGLAMTTWMTHALLDSHPVVGLWQYSDNAPATALYDKLGYHDDHRYLSGALKV